nr:reverse transcriptase domain-containing protein [Tanacetum cinerariifolium]
MIKEHDQQAKVKATPKKLVYGSFDEEDSDSLGTKGLLERLSNESFGTSETRDIACFSGQSQRSLSRSRASSHLRLSKRLENRSKSNAKSREGRTKTRGKWSEPREASLDIDYREDSKHTCDDLSTLYKRPKPTPFITRITRFKYQEKVKLPRKVKVYEGSKDPEDHLGIFSAAAEREEWPMPVWCKMFCQTLSGAARNCGTKEMLVPDGPTVKKGLGEGAVQGSFEGIWGHVRPTQEDTRSRPSLKFQRKSWRWKRNGSRTRGMKVINMVGSGGCHNRLYEMEGPELTKEIDFSTIPRNSLTYAPIILEGTIEGYYLRRIYVDGVSSSEIMFEHYFKSFNADINSRLKKFIVPLIRFSGEIYHPLGLVDLRVTMGEPRRNKTKLQEFSIVKCRSLYNVIMRRTGMKSLGAVGSTIHSIIKFLIARGVATLKNSNEAIWECKQIEEMQSSWKETRWRQHMEQMSIIKDQAILRNRSIPDQRPRKEPMIFKET